MMDSPKIKVSAGYPTSGHVVLTMRMISILEGRNYSAKFGEIKAKEAPDKRSELEYAILVDGLAAYVDGDPIFRSPEGTESHLVEGAETPAAAIRTYFAEKTMVSERIANKLIVEFQNALVPESPVFP